MHIHSESGEVEWAVCLGVSEYLPYVVTLETSTSQQLMFKRRHSSFPDICKQEKEMMDYKIGNFFPWLFWNLFSISYKGVPVVI